MGTVATLPCLLDRHSVASHDCRVSGDHGLLCAHLQREEITLSRATQRANKTAAALTERSVTNAVNTNTNNARQRLREQVLRRHERRMNVADASAALTRPPLHPRPPRGRREDPVARTEVSSESASDGGSVAQRAEEVVTLSQNVQGDALSQQIGLLRDVCGGIKKADHLGADVTVFESLATQLEVQKCEQKGATETQKVRANPRRHRVEVSKRMMHNFVKKRIQHVRGLDRDQLEAHQQNLEVTSPRRDFVTQNMAGCTLPRQCETHEEHAMRACNVRETHRRFLHTRQQDVRTRLVACLCKREGNDAPLLFRDDGDGARIQHPTSFEENSIMFAPESKRIAATIRRDARARCLAKLIKVVSVTERVRRIFVKSLAEFAATADRDNTTAAAAGVEEESPGFVHLVRATVNFHKTLSDRARERMQLAVRARHQRYLHTQADRVKHFLSQCRLRDFVRYMIRTYRKRAMRCQHEMKGFILAYKRRTTLWMAQLCQLERWVLFVERTYFRVRNASDFKRSLQLVSTVKRKKKRVPAARWILPDVKEAFEGRQIELRIPLENKWRAVRAVHAKQRDLLYARLHVWLETSQRERGERPLLPLLIDRGAMFDILLQLRQELEVSTKLKVQTAFKLRLQIALSASVAALVIIHSSTVNVPGRRFKLIRKSLSCAFAMRPMHPLAPPQPTKSLFPVIQSVQEREKERLKMLAPEN